MAESENLPLPVLRGKITLKSRHAYFLINSLRLKPKLKNWKNRSWNLSQRLKCYQDAHTVLNKRQWSLIFLILAILYKHWKFLTIFECGIVMTLTEPSVLRVGGKSRGVTLSLEQYSQSNLAASCISDRPHYGYKIQINIAGDDFVLLCCSYYSCFSASWESGRFRLLLFAATRWAEIQRPVVWRVDILFRRQVPV